MENIRSAQDAASLAMSSVSTSLSDGFSEQCIHSMASNSPSEPQRLEQWVKSSPSHRISFALPFCLSFQRKISSTFQDFPIPRDRTPNSFHTTSYWCHPASCRRGIRANALDQTLNQISARSTTSRRTRARSREDSRGCAGPSK